MKRAATSANALRLPPPPPMELQVVAGRQKVMRHGIYLGFFGGKRRTFYMQFDGEIILAAECKCPIEWLEVERDSPKVGFRVKRELQCPIDEHRAAAVRYQGDQAEATDDEATTQKQFRAKGERKHGKQAEFDGAHGPANARGRDDLDGGSARAAQGADRDLAAQS